MSVATPAVYKGRWGYHSCSYEQYLFLKKAHKLFYRAYRDCKRWIAWQRKTVYRSAEEPLHPSMFIERGYHKIGEKIWYGFGFSQYNHQNLYLLVLEAYQIARRPVNNPEDVKQIELPSNLIEKVKLLEAFYASHN